MSVFICTICNNEVDSDVTPTIEIDGEQVCEYHTEDKETAVRYAIGLAKQIQDKAVLAGNFEIETLADRIDETLSQHLPWEE